jgi:hypothetical protein
MLYTSSFSFKKLFSDETPSIEPHLRAIVMTMIMTMIEDVIENFSYQLHSLKEEDIPGSSKLYWFDSGAFGDGENTDTSAMMIAEKNAADPTAAAAPVMTLIKEYLSSESLREEDFGRKNPFFDTTLTQGGRIQKLGTNLIYKPSHLKSKSTTQIIGSITNIYLKIF